MSTTTVGWVAAGACSGCAWRRSTRRAERRSVIEEMKRLCTDHSRRYTGHKVTAHYTEIVEYENGQ